LEQGDLERCDGRGRTYALQGEDGHDGRPQGGEEEVLVLAREQVLLRDVVREQALRGRRGTRTGRQHFGGGSRCHATGQHQVHVVAGALEHLCKPRNILYRILRVRSMSAVKLFSFR
jgi:hypothetical protein